MTEEQDKKKPEAADQGEATEESTDTDELRQSFVPPDEEQTVAAGDEVDEGGTDTVVPLLAEVQRQLAEADNRALRAQAELENVRKRTIKEIERIRKYSLESFASALLEVKDNLERSLVDHGAAVDVAHQAEAVTLEKVCEGVGLTLKSLEGVFSSFGIEEIAPLEQNFDPELHQAISTIKTADYPPRTVIELTQKGYVLNGRLLRPAMVVVAAAPDADANAAGAPARGQNGTGEDAPEA